jgi:hypothetical protein
MAALLFWMKRYREAAAPSGYPRGSFLSFRSIQNVEAKIFWNAGVLLRLFG